MRAPNVKKRKTVKKKKKRPGEVKIKNEIIKK